MDTPIIIVSPYSRGQLFSVGQLSAKEINSIWYNMAFYSDSSSSNWASNAYDKKAALQFILLF